MSQNINLYDPSLRLRRDLLGFGAAAAAVGFALVLVAALAAFARTSLARIEPVAARLASDLLTEQATLQTLAAQAASSKPDPALQNGIAHAQLSLLQRRAALQTLETGGAGREGGFAERLEALARQSIDGLWLTGLVLRQNDVLLRGRALDPALIPLYVRRLEREPSLQGRAFKALDVNRPLNAADRTSPAAAAQNVVNRPLDAAGRTSPAAAAQNVETLAAARAEFVEFTLTGSGDDEAAAAGNPGAAR